MTVKKVINGKRTVVKDSDDGSRTVLSPVLHATDKTKRSDVTTAPQISEQNTSGRKNYFNDYVAAATPTYEQALRNVSGINSDEPYYSTASGLNANIESYINKERGNAAKEAMFEIDNDVDEVVDKLASLYGVSNPRTATQLYVRDVPQGTLPTLYNENNNAYNVNAEMDKIYRDAAAGYQYDINGNGKNNYGYMTGTPYQPGTYSPTNAFLNRDWDITQQRNPYVPKSKRSGYHTEIGYG